jgi:hypothetical protein
MSKRGSHPTILDLLKNYKQSMTAYFEARDNEQFDKQKVTVDRVDRIVEALDFFGVEGRRALIPLLDEEFGGKLGRG